MNNTIARGARHIDIHLYLEGIIQNTIKMNSIVFVYP